MINDNSRLDCGDYPEPQHEGDYIRQLEAQNTMWKQRLNEANLDIVRRETRIIDLSRYVYVLEVKRDILTFALRKIRDWEFNIQFDCVKAAQNVAIDALERAEI